MFRNESTVSKAVDSF